MPTPRDLAYLHEDMTAWRRHFHAHPELRYEERKTSDFIAEKLEGWGIPVTRGLGKTGLVGVIEGEKGEGGTIGLRADMDALPITEKPTHDHGSRHAGVMHACGHDGHMAILLGAACHLAKHRNFAGRVHVIFQPAEEGGAGAKAMIEDGLFERFPCDRVFALHNSPMHPAGTMGVKTGPVMAAVDEFFIHLRGRGGHAAMPHQTRDCIPVGAEIVLALQTLVSRNVSPLDSAVLSVTTFSAGTTTNVIPAELELTGTVRSFTEPVRDLMEARIRTVVSGIAAAHEVDAEVRYDRVYPATRNHDAEAELARRAAEAVVGTDKLLTNLRPVMGGEDFAFMLEACPGAFVWLGQSRGPEDPMLHTPSYDFNDDVLPIGAAFFVTLVEMGQGEG